MKKERKYVCLVGLPVDSPLLEDGFFECKPDFCSRFFYETDWKDGHEKCYLRRWKRDKQ